MSAGWGFLLTLASSGISILHPATPNPFMAGSDYLCTAIIAMNTFQHSSRVAGNILRRNGFWWTCMFNLRGRTNSYPPLGCQNSMSRAVDECVIVRPGQAHLKAPCGQAKGVPLHRGIPSSVNSPPRPLEETRL
jgi:hypothetical protein